MTDERRPSGFWTGFESNDHLKRFLIVFAGMAVLMTGCCWVLFSLLGITVSSPTVRIGLAGNESVSEGIRRISFARSGLQIEMRSGEVFANALVPANKLWVDTNIIVQPGSRVRLTANGSADLSQTATLRINENPDAYNVNAYYFLVDPYGYRLDTPTPRYREADELRNAIKLTPTARIGTLVATVAGSAAILAANPRAGEIFTIETPEDGYVYTGARPGRLFLAVNDLVGSAAPRDREYWLLRRRSDTELYTPADARENIRRAYLFPTSTEAEVDERIRWAEHLWDSISRRRYFHYFYEDNAGFYMVSISVSASGD